MRISLIFINFGLFLVALAQVGCRSRLLDDCIDGEVWVKEPGIRIDFDGADPQGTTNFHAPFVHALPDGSFRMYYDAAGAVRSAVSKDGLVFRKEPGARLTGGAHPYVIERPGGGLRLYFERLENGIGSAVSTDGLDFTPEPGDRIVGAVDPELVDAGGGVLRMYFRGGNTDSNIRSALSADGLSFSVEDGIRVAGSREFAAFRRGDAVFLYYGIPDPIFARIDSARSTDGLRFTVEPGARLRRGPDPLDAGGVVSTSVVVLPGAPPRMYYQGGPDATDINKGGRVFSAVPRACAAE